MRAAQGLRQLVRFAVLETRSCAFAAAVFAGLAVSSAIPLPIPRYDALLVYCLALTVGFWAVRLETTRELGVIFAFHLVGIALELYKVRHGSWAYPEDASTKVGGVPLYSGFLYAAVGSYICQAWRRLDLRVTGYPAAATTALAAAIYANFFTHHVLPDARWVLAALLIVVLRRSRIYFTVGTERYRMPLTVSFVLIGFFLWLAENAGTFLGGWRYPDQADVWRMVHAGKFGSWSLLVTVSFVLVATMKATEGRLYGDRDALPTVVTTAAGTAPDTPEVADPVRSQACSTSSEEAPGTPARPGS
jgi:uncharacterized membrane protein YoaT (DUF817 family)